jgi:uncharacterized protein (DUF952 family)
VRPTFHLVAEPVWVALDASAPYTHPSLDAEGFIHCTDGAQNMRDTANRFYRDDPRPFVILTVDLDAAGSPWRVDDPGTPFPHVYGPIQRAAILDVRPMPRGADGSFSAPSEA